MRAGINRTRMDSNIARVLIGNKLYRVCDIAHYGVTRLSALVQADNGMLRIHHLLLLVDR